MIFSTRTLIALVAQSAAITATPWFHNKGTKDDSSQVGSFSGWDAYNHEAQGTVDQVSNVFLEGPSSLKFTQTYVPGYKDRYHSEAIKLKAYTNGDQGYYGFAFRLHSSWDTTSTQGFNIAQFIADFTVDENNTCNETWLPSMSECPQKPSQALSLLSFPVPLSKGRLTILLLFLARTVMWVNGTSLVTRRKGNKMCGPWTQGVDYEEYTISNGITPGQWYKIVIQASWQSAATGFFRVWIDGVKTVDDNNIITTYVDTNKAHHFQFSCGLYAYSWHDEHRLVGSGDRQVWIDEVGIGTEMADADPDQW